MIKLKDNEYWGYSESNYGILDKGERIDVYYVARGISKQKFIDTIRKSSITYDEPTWIRDRTSAAGNKTSLKIAKKYDGKVVVIAHGFSNQQVKNDTILRILTPSNPVIVENPNGIF